MRDDVTSPRPARLWSCFSQLWELAGAGGARRAKGLILLLHLVLIGGGYLAVLRLAEWRGVSVWDPTSAVDRWFPALPWTFVIYSTLYLYWPVTVALAPRGKRGVEVLLYNLQAQVLLSAVTWVIFLVLPTEILVRAEMETTLTTSSELARSAFEQLYSVDAPWNSWPSLHVSLSLLMVFCWAQFSGESSSRRRRLVLWIATPCWLALCLSILTTKQHFFLDIWTGALAGCLTWRLYLRGRLLESAAREAQKA